MVEGEVDTNGKNAGTVGAVLGDNSGTEDLIATITARVNVYQNYARDA